MHLQRYWLYDYTKQELQKKILGTNFNAFNVRYNFNSQISMLSRFLYNSQRKSQNICNSGTNQCIKVHGN